MPRTPVAGRPLQPAAPLAAAAAKWWKDFRSRALLAWPRDTAHLVPHRRTQMPLAPLLTHSLGHMGFAGLGPGKGPGAAAMADDGRGLFIWGGWP
jgi:hypothetical protein